MTEHVYKKGVNRAQVYVKTGHKMWPSTGPKCSYKVHSSQQKKDISETRGKVVQNLLVHNETGRLTPGIPADSPSEPVGLAI